MRIVTWNMAAGFEYSEERHRRAWEYLRDLNVDIALLQETIPPPWAHDHWRSVIASPKYPSAAEGRNKWGSAIVTRDIELEPCEPSDETPWLKMLWGGTIVAQTVGEP